MDKLCVIIKYRGTGLSFDVLFSIILAGTYELQDLVNKHSENRNTFHAD